MGLDQYAHLRNRKIDWAKYYDGDEEEQKDVFVWRKHARLQTFMHKMFEKQNQEQLKKEQEKDKDKEFNPFDMSHLGMNGYDEVYITEDVVKDLEKEVKSNFYNSFTPDGFFWGQQFQEEAVKEYKAQDQEFLKWCKEQVKAGRSIGYDCSW